MVCRKELLDYFEIQWSDTDKAVVLSSDLEQRRLELNGEEAINAQNAIYQYLQQRI
jgi:polyphosphate kinase